MKKTYATSNQQAGSIGGGIVGKSDLDAITWQFMGVCGTDHNITFNLGISNLANDVLVGETNNHSVLGSVVLVSVLNNQSSTGIVVGFSLYCFFEGTKKRTVFRT